MSNKRYERILKQFLELSDSSEFKEFRQKPSAAIRDQLFIKVKRLCRSVQKEIDSEISESDLTQVFFAILELKAPKIYIAQIVDYLNQEREQRQTFFTNKAVAKIAVALGFTKKHTNRGRAIIWNDLTVERLKKRYVKRDACMDA